MRVEPTGFAGLLIVDPRTFRDERGLFRETFQEPRYRSTGIGDIFVQDNHSRSAKGVLRGLHFQVKYPQAQLVTVIRGRIFDAVVDLRRGSATFGLWFGVELGEDGPCQMYMAPGFAHGFCVLSDHADLHYKVSRIYDHADEGGLVWSDPDIGIRWPITAPVVAQRDAGFPRLRDLGHDRLPHVADA